MLTLDRSVQTINLQFSFLDGRHVPDSIREIEHETVREQASRKQRESSSSAGICFIEPIENTSIVQFVDNIESAGYEMVDAVYQPRPLKRDPRVTYHMVRFIFVQKMHANPSEHFVKVRSTIREELARKAMQAMWRVRAYLNPFFKDGKMVDGQNALSLNFEVPKPLFLDDGAPVVRWKNGDAPLPIQPEFQLLLEEGAILIVPFSGD